MRAIDADKMLDDITAAEKHRGMGAVVAGTLRRYIMRQPALTQLNEWVSVENALPPEHEPVLCIVSGKPKANIILEEAYQLGSWNKADGWIIDEYLDWEDADVSWWRKLPEPPDRRPPEGDCEIKACAETCDECGFCDDTLASPPEGEEDT